MADVLNVGSGEGAVLAAVGHGLGAEGSGEPGVEGVRVESGYVVEDGEEGLSVRSGEDDDDGLSVRSGEDDDDGLSVRSGENDDDGLSVWLDEGGVQGDWLGKGVGFGSGH
jgi:hypothetical protein